MTDKQIRILNDIKIKEVVSVRRAEDDALTSISFVFEDGDVIMVESLENKSLSVKFGNREELIKKSFICGTPPMYPDLKVLNLPMRVE